ncbi:MAG: hypothetical protein DMD65_08810 [Gemmatimonadetes bacterium]|nr:MAG: hypothetical protein DMD65_08810 [Gemmatimonadota bacterium]
MRYPAILALGLLGGTAGCDLFDNALEVQSPSTIPAGTLEIPANAQLLANGAIADFECAVGSYAVMGGEITDELIDATQTADRYPYERRTMTSSDTRYAVNSCVGLGVYTPLQTARFSALNVLSLLQGWTNAQVPGRDTLIATLQAYEGYGLVLLGEGFCTMVVSTLDANRQTVYGGEIQRDSVFKLAIGYFGDAITGATATGQTAVVNMALVGRARAYADLGQLAPAAADAQLVASGFVKNVTASAINARRNNRIWQENSATSDNTTLDSVYTNMTDPRVPFSVKLDKNGKQRNSVTGYPLYQQNKFTAASTPLRLASWDEARLIIAEADWAATDYAHADSIINIFRARGGQSAITSIDRDTVKFALFDQRRREFFLEGQHLGDVIRFGFLPDPPVGTVFKGGGTYGTQLCLPLPDVEKQNNPNF